MASFSFSISTKNKEKLREMTSSHGQSMSDWVRKQITNMVNMGYLPFRLYNSDWFSLPYDNSEGPFQCQMDDDVADRFRASLNGMSSSSIFRGLFTAETYELPDNALFELKERLGDKVVSKILSDLTKFLPSSGDVSYMSLEMFCRKSKDYFNKSLSPLTVDDCEALLHEVTRISASEEDVEEMREAKRIQKKRREHDRQREQEYWDKVYGKPCRKILKKGTFNQQIRLASNVATIQAAYDKQMQKIARKDLTVAIGRDFSYWQRAEHRAKEIVDAVGYSEKGVVTMLIKARY